MLRALDPHPGQNEAERMSDELLAAYIFLNTNWKFEFLRPTMEEIVAEYVLAYARSSVAGRGADR